MLNTLITMKTTWDTLLTKLYVTKVKGVPKSFFSLIGVGNACLGTTERAGIRVLIGIKKREHLGAGQPGVSLIALTLTSKTLSESTEKKESKTRLYMGLNSWNAVFLLL